MLTPVGSYVAQRRLQHVAPHAAVPSQTMPSTAVHVVAIVVGAAQVPSAPLVVHVPEQQSPPVVHTSPVCPQYDDAEHTPP